MSAAQTDLWTRGVSNHMLYHMVMARREVLVQLEDDLVARLDELAKRAGVSRSELIRRGATAVLDADELGRKDRELVDAYRKTPPDPVLLKASIRLAAENTPEW